jgi:hypothetical protein
MVGPLIHSDERKHCIWSWASNLPAKCKKKKKDIVCLRVIDSIHYKLPLMVLETYVATFGLFIL